MKRFIVRGALLALLCAPLANCVTDGTGAPIIAAPVDNTSVIGNVQSQAAKICGFVPAGQTIADIVGTFTGTTAITSLVGTVASGICNAITKKGASRGGKPPTYRGVPVQGSFVTAR